MKKFVNNVLVITAEIFFTNKSKGYNALSRRSVFPFSRPFPILRKRRKNIFALAFFGGYVII